MRLRFPVLEGTAAPHRDRPLFMLERTYSSAFRTSLLFTQLTGLLLSRRFQSPCQQTAHGRHPDVFHLRQIDVEPRALLAPVLPHDDFSPPLREFLDPLEIFRCRFTCSHVASLQRDPSIRPDEILP